MPLYDYECSKCEAQVERSSSIQMKDSQKCDYCGGSLILLITCNKRDWFRPHWNEHIDHEPVYIESKEHYKKLCKEKGVMARCLM